MRTTKPRARKMMMMGTSDRMYGSVARMHWPEPPLAADLASMRTDMLLVLRVLPSSTDLRRSQAHPRCVHATASCHR